MEIDWTECEIDASIKGNNEKSAQVATVETGGKRRRYVHCTVKGNNEKSAQVATVEPGGKRRRYVQ